MAFDDLMAELNRDCLDEFGRPLTFTPAATGIPQSITGILDEAAELEDEAPGQSVNALLWCAAADIDPVPAAGDEIATATTVYKILLPKRDAAGGLMLHLRRDRELV